VRVTVEKREAMRKAAEAASEAPGEWCAGERLGDRRSKTRRVCWVRNRAIGQKQLAALQENEQAKAAVDGFRRWVKGG
jgi:hypothetical protein